MRSRRAIVDFERLSQDFRKLYVCPQCKNMTLSLRTDNKSSHVLDAHPSVFCLACEEVEQDTDGYLATRESDGKKIIFSSDM